MEAQNTRDVSLTAISICDMGAEDVTWKMVAVMTDGGTTEYSWKLICDPTMKN